MKKRLTVIAIALAILAGLGYWLYDRLGGTNPIQISVVNTNPPTLIGMTYEGTPQDEGLGETFAKIEAILSTQPGKKLHTIYEVEPAGKLDTMRVFVGLEGIQVDSLEVRRFTEDSFLIASLEANRWVMPGPAKVQQKLKEYAEANNIALTGVFIDKILSEDKVQVIAPIARSK
ncbi:hypothetical protein ACFOSV_08425 [Algoriphagus namhaensis]|uniref:GyrI-like small molecule binding domain-containing protein n=1 Tax=Algoriphagus namhaensis TaxID=915353 RepID=A0ABV8AQE2_9BACT